MSDRGSEEGSDQTKPPFRTQYSAEEPPSLAVCRALASIEGVEPTDLDILYESIDPDALDAIFDSPESKREVVVEFRAAGHRVIVESDGNITIPKRSE